MGVLVAMAPLPQWSAMAAIAERRFISAPFAAIAELSERSDPAARPTRFAPPVAAVLAMTQ